jgi:hypothetical protein
VYWIRLCNSEVINQWMKRVFDKITGEQWNIKNIWQKCKSELCKVKLCLSLVFYLAQWWKFLCRKTSVDIFRFQVSPFLSNEVSSHVKCFWCFIVHLLFYRIHVSFIDLLLQNYTAVTNTHFHLNLPYLGLFHFIRTHGQSLCTSLFR